MIIVAGTLAACATTNAPPPTDPRDPDENFNRKLFAAHLVVDRNAVKPIAKGYEKIPQPIRRSLRNFFDNLRAPVIFINDILQGEIERGSETLTRFFLNSFIGVGGLVDIGTHFGIEKHEEDFGQTMAVWGVPEGAYSFTPAVGPTPWRHFGGLVVDALLNPLTYTGAGAAWTITPPLMRGLDSRTNALTALDEIEKNSVDYYASLRSLYYQNRAYEIQNGVLDTDSLPEIDFEDE